MKKAKELNFRPLMKSRYHFEFHTAICLATVLENIYMLISSYMLFNWVLWIYWKIVPTSFSLKRQFKNIVSIITIYNYYAVESKMDYQHTYVYLHQQLFRNQGDLSEISRQKKLGKYSRHRAEYLASDPLA